MSLFKRVRRELPPISREEVEAKEADYNHSKHHPPVVRPTSKSYRRVGGLWEEFLLYILETPPFLQLHEEIPTAGRLKMFMEWIFDTSNGVLAERITLKTLKTTWYCFRSMYERATDNAISREDGRDVLNFIRTDLRDKGLAQVRREKSMADALDVAWILTYLWCYDTYQPRHPRKFVQDSLVALLVVYTGARIGCLIESSAYRGSNEAMCYKDFEIIGLPTGPMDTLELVLKVRFRLEKGRRDQGGNDREEFKWVTFHEDRICRGRCPVTHFLGLAFADDAFDDLTCPSLIKYLTPGLTEDGTVAPNIAMNYNEGARDLLALGLRMGLRDALRYFNLRRGAANEFDGDSEVSPNQYSQLLGHAVKTMGASYISNISALDVQGIVNHESLRHEHVRMLRSMRLHLNPNAPSHLSTLQTKEILDEPKIVQLDIQLKDLERQLRIDGESPELRKKHTETYWTRKRCFTDLYHKAWIKFRNLSFEVADSNMIRKMIRDGLDREMGIGNNEEPDSKLLDVSSLKFVSSTHFPDRHFVANAFWAQATLHETSPDTKLIQSLANLSNPSKYIHYYFGEAPVEGCCPFCRQNIAEIPGNERSLHIHQCARRHHQEISEKIFKDSALACCDWGPCRGIFTQKVSHLPPQFAGHISDPAERKKLRSKESKRLHDLRRKKIPDLSRNPEPQSRKAIANHLKSHLKTCKNVCLWNSCNFQCSSDQDLHRHLWKSHGITTRQAAFEPQFCFEHSDDGWFIDEFEWEHHCELHVIAPRHNMNLAQSGQMFTAGLQCPFCLVDPEKPFSRRFTQFTNRGTFNVHMAIHEKTYVDKLPLRCPVSLCCGDLYVSYSKLQIHFLDAHNLKPKGYTRSYGFGLGSIAAHNNEVEYEENSESEPGENDLVLGELYDDEDDENDWNDDSDDDWGGQGGNLSKRKFLDTS